VAVALMAGDARQVVLGRVRAALGPAAAPAGEIPRAYRPAGRSPDPPGAVLDRFCERVQEYRARVHRVSAGALDDVVAELLADRRVLVASEPPCGLQGFEELRDDPLLSARELDVADAVLTGCALAVAETGTIVLDGSGRCGRRALTLVPDHHVCVVRAEQIVVDVPDMIAALRSLDAMRRPITLVSGPSATSDIELERVEGVHGPRLLDVVVVVA
jgi:L-lactate dehydrogenase complex protein LldG